MGAPRIFPELSSNASRISIVAPLLNSIRCESSQETAKHG